MTLYSQPGCAGSPATTALLGADGSFRLPVTVPYRTITTFSATATDPVGNTSACSQPISYEQLCVPRTCAGQGKNCGLMTDGCGTEVFCGNCTHPQYCGGDGRPNICGRYSHGGHQDFGVGGPAQGELLVYQTYTYHQWRTPNAIVGQCRNASGVTQGEEFVIDQSPQGFYYTDPTVSMARDSGATLVSWSVYPYVGGENRVPRARLYGADCQPLTPAFDFSDTTASFYQRHPTAIDAAGNFVLGWKRRDPQTGQTSAYLSFYDAAGARRFPDRLIDDTQKCQSSYAMRVALNPSTGAGVVTCQQPSAQAIAYRRFDANGTFLDATMQNVPGLTDNLFFGSDTHAVGMNDLGEMVVEWFYPRQCKFEASFLDASGSLRRKVTLPQEADTSAYVYVFNRENMTVPIMSGGDFVLESGAGSGRPHIYWRYRADGTFVGCDSNRNYAASRIRTNGLEETYASQGDRVVRNALNLNQVSACTSPTCGDGTVDQGEECDDGNRVHGDGCNQACKLERCGDGVVSGAETCDDGNTNSGDGCSASCQLEPRPPASVTTFPTAHDYDVAADGSAVTVRFHDYRIKATCYKPDRTLRRAEFPVAVPDFGVNSPSVYVSRQSRRTLVLWQQCYEIWGAVLDENCLRVREPFPVTQNPDYGFDPEAAIDDQGRSVIVRRAPNSSDVAVTFLDANGQRVGSDEQFGCGGGGGTQSARVAMNQATGAGVVTCQRHSGDVLYYRRFSAERTWLDANAVKVPAGYVWYHEGHTVGMNDQGAFVVQWRGQTGAHRAAFYSAAGALVSNLTFSTRLRQGESYTTGNATYYNLQDNFHRQHQELALLGDNFVLGETYNSSSDRNSTYYVYTPAGALVRTYSTSDTVNGGLFVRTDAQGVSYFGRGGDVVFGPGRL